MNAVNYAKSPEKWGARAFFVHSAMLATALLWSAGCAGASVAPADQATTTISLQNINCSACARTSAKAARATPGVLGVTVDLAKAELKVRYDRRTASPAEVAKQIHKAGYKAVLGAGKGSYKAHVSFDAAMDVKTLKQPAPELKPESLAVAGKVTVVDYGAAWCAPCRKVDREMYAQLLKNKKLALRRLDIGDWDSPFAKKHLANVSALPFLLVYGADGKRIARIEGLKLPALRKAIAAGLGAGAGNGAGK